MIAACQCTPEAKAMLRGLLGMAGEPDFDRVEVEFKEVPYFLVSRSRQKWDAERGDIHDVVILSASERGIIADPDSEPVEAIDGISQARRHTLIPWSNILSLTVTRATG